VVLAFTPSNDYVASRGAGLASRWCRL